VQYESFSEGRLTPSAILRAGIQIFRQRFGTHETKALRLNQISIARGVFRAAFWISGKGQIQEDSSLLRETAIDAAREVSEIQRFAK